MREVTKLEKFLEEKELLELFKSRVVAAALDAEMYISRFGNIPSAIMAAFTWGMTPQGVGFWSDLHDEFISYCQEETEDEASN